MHAIEVAELGGPEVLSYVDRPQPVPGAGEVLIKAEAIGVNFIDTYFRTGIYPHELPFVLGAEVAGTVEAVGDGVTAAAGRGSCRDRGCRRRYAELSLAPVGLVAKLPDGVASDVAAAALLKGITAHLLVKSVHPVQAGETVLLHAGAGGVGLIMTQWATSLGARVITTASTPAKAQLSRRAGAIEVLDYPDDPQQFGHRIRELTDGKPRQSSTTASASQRSTPAWLAWPSGAPSPCSAHPAARYPHSTRNG